MDERDLVAFLFRTLLEEVFVTKTRMAEALGIPFRTLQWIFQHLGMKKGGSLGFQRLIWYCCEKDVDVTVLFRRYKRRRKIKHQAKAAFSAFGAEARCCSEELLDKVYAAFDHLLHTVCLGCVGKSGENGWSACALTRVADALADKGMIAQYLTREVNTMEENNLGILRWMLLEAFDQYFHSNYAAMAAALQLPEVSIHKALEIEQWRSSTEVFERMVAYCLANGLGLDALIRHYRER